LTTSFSELGLSAQLVSALTAAGFTTPTPIQAKAIPPQLERRDIIGIAQTGSGKTAAFGAADPVQDHGARRPSVDPKTARALILAPTRELAVQIEDTIKCSPRAGARSRPRWCSAAPRAAGRSRRSRRGVDVLIATPGRLTDLVRRSRAQVLAETRMAGARRGRPHARHGLHQ
jgi:ATP-dependent RNA helicase RhlE